VALVAVVAGVAVAAQWGRRAYLGGGVPTGAAEWIWAALPRRSTDPAAFWAVRDFTLAEVPPAVELLALADEEYVAWLNGQRVGSNRYRPGARLDRYAVAELLLPGANRLAVELRSSAGAGGFLAALTAGEGEPVLVTDGSWRVLRRHHPGLLPAWQPLTDGEPPESLGRPPVGRWGVPVAGPTRPLALAAAALCQPVAPRARADEDGATVFDWGGEVYGYLTVRRAPAPAGGPEVALFLTGDRPRRPLGEPEAALPLVALPGSPEWTDTVPRRFRYATVTGLAGLGGAAVLPVDPRAAPRLPRAVPPDRRGVFGIQPPPYLTPAEKRVRRRLDRGEPGQGGD
jgi:hypothetical protein